MKKLFNKIARWTEGKKTYAGIALHVGLAAFTFFTGKISFKESLQYHGYISALTGVGAAHKIKRKLNENKNKPNASTEVSD